MPVLLSDAAAAKWTLGHTTSQVGEVSISPVTGTSLQLLPRDRMDDITTPFEPSAFQGTGDEVRKGVLFSVPDDVYAGIAAIEAWVQGALEEPYAIWNPSVRPPGRYGATLKAKLNVSGPHACLAYDAAGQPREFPTDWRGLPVIPVIEVRGVYSHSTGAGLLLEVTVLMIGERQARSVTFV